MWETGRRKAADLTGEQIVFNRPWAGSQTETTANISYLRLAPMSAAEIERVQRDRQPGKHRQLIANYDGGQHHV